MKNLKYNLKIFARRIVYNSIFFLDTYVLHNKPNVFILCYHSIADDNWKYGVSMETLQKQIKYLLERYNPVSLKDIELYIQGKKNIQKSSFAVTFDDGYKEVLKAKNFFADLGIIPAFFLLSDTKNADRKELDTNRDFLTKEEIKNLQKAGWVLGSHGATHADFYNLSDKQIEKEVIDSKKSLEKDFNTKISYFAYPKGRYTEKVLSAVKKAGYSFGLTMNDGFISSSVNPYLVPRVGVDRTHTFDQFRGIFLPSAIRLRKFIKENIGVII